MPRYDAVDENCKVILNIDAASPSQAAKYALDRRDEGREMIYAGVESVDIVSKRGAWQVTVDVSFHTASSGISTGYYAVLESRRIPQGTLGLLETIQDERDREEERKRPMAIVRSRKGE